MQRHPLIDDEAAVDGPASSDEDEEIEEEVIPSGNNNNNVVDDVDELQLVSSPTKFAPGKGKEEDKDSSPSWKDTVQQAVLAHFTARVMGIDSYASVASPEKADLVYFEYWSDEIPIPWNKIKSQLRKEGRVVIFCPQQNLVKMMKQASTEVSSFLCIHSY